MKRCGVQVGPPRNPMDLRAQFVIFDRMDLKYLIGPGVFFIGALLGLLFRPRTLAWICAAFFIAAVVGIAVGYATGNEALGFAFGVAAMTIPGLGAGLVAAAAIGRAIVQRYKAKERTDDAT